MNKQGLVASVAEKSGLTKKTAAAVVDAFIRTIKAELVSGGKVSILGFGTFEVRERRGRTGRNPRTGEPVAIPGRKVPVFRPGAELKEAVR